MQPGTSKATRSSARLQATISLEARCEARKSFGTSQAFLHGPLIGLDLDPGIPKLSYRAIAWRNDTIGNDRGSARVNTGNRTH